MKVTVILVKNKVKWYNPTTWLFGAIRYFTNSEYNHGVIAVNKNPYGTYVYEARETIKMFPYITWLLRAKRESVLAFTFEYDSKIVDILDSKVGKIYQFNIYLYYILKKLGLANIVFKLFPKFGNRGLYCFELIRQALPEMFQDNSESDIVSANDIIKALSNFEHYELND